MLSTARRASRAGPSQFARLLAGAAPEECRSILNKIGRFEIIGELGRERMSVIYRARDPATDRTVALTVPSADSSDSPELLARFYREARAAGSLQHPNIIAVYDLGVDRGSPYIAMELLDGEDLGQIVEREKKEGGRSPQSAAVMLEYVIQACQGLGFAHQKGVIHRDVRPANIFVAKDGRVKVTHFVNARLPSALSPISGVMMSGTSEYMSPELVRGDRVDAATDIWSMGCTMYEILTYTKPFQCEDGTARMIAIMSQEPKPLGELRPDLPREIDKVVRRTLRKVRTDRYRNMEALVAELEPIVWKMKLPGGGGS